MLAAVSGVRSLLLQRPPSSGRIGEMNEQLLTLTLCLDWVALQLAHFHVTRALRVVLLCCGPQGLLASHVRALLGWLGAVKYDCAPTTPDLQS